MTQIDDQMLMAYSDGELNDLDRRRVEKAVEADPLLKAQLEAYIALNAEISQAVDDASAAPLSAGLAEALEATRGVVLMPAANDKGPRSFWNTCGQVAAVAAVIVGGFWLTNPNETNVPTNTQLASFDAGVSTELAEYLDTLPNNSQVAGLIIEESYVSNNTALPSENISGFCRTFRIEDNVTREPLKRGLACRQSAGSWRLEALVPEIPKGAYMPAGPEQQHPIDALVKTMHKLDLGREIAHLRE